MEFRCKILGLSSLVMFLASCEDRKVNYNPSGVTNEMITLADSSVDNKDFYLPKTRNGKVVKHKFYTLSYVEEHEQAEWVAYELKREDIVYSNLK